MEPTVVHASCVALGDRGLLIIGASGSGKSALALELMAFGATLVGDDRIALTATSDALIATAPAGLPHMIEARGVGLLHAELQPEAAVVAVVDLDLEEDNRLPERCDTMVAGVSLPLLRRPAFIHFAPALIQFLRHGRHTP